MSASSRKLNIATAAGAVHSLRRANIDIQPPAHVSLSDRDMPFWHSLIEEFSKAELTTHKLELVAMLARAMSDLVEQQELLRDEGMTSVTERGTPVVNPRKAVVQMLAGTILSMRRSLAIHAKGETGGNDKAAAQRGRQKALEADVESAIDDFIKRPSS